jgi:hypothetical protein
LRRAALAACGLLAWGPARAEGDPRLAFLERQLGSASDPRVRAQAALTLGTTEAPGARGLLCTALGDPAPLVRVAAARSLPELHELEALDCLLAHPTDPDPLADAEVRRAMARLREVKTRVPTVAVWVEGVRDPSDPPLGPELCAETQTRLVTRLAWGGARTGVARAAVPAAPSRALPAFLLKPTLLRVERGVELAAVCLTWPGKHILGEVRVRGSGGTPLDLVRVLVPRLLDDASRTFEWNLQP